MRKIFQLSIVIVLASASFLFSEEAELRTSSGTLYGTLEISASSGPTKIVLIIAGSGPTDRNGNFMAGAPNDSLKMLAEKLTGCGISSLRYDKRGIGASKNAMVREDDLAIETLIDDAVQWIRQLKTDNRFSGVYVLGHSEGSLIGMVASEKAKANGFISIAGLGRRASDTVLEQLKTQLPDNLLNDSKIIIEHLEKGETVKEVSQALYPLFRPSIQPYMISWFRYDPQAEIGKLKVPVLVIQGTTDIQVPKKEAMLLSKASPISERKLIRSMNHVLKKVPKDNERQQKSYIDPSIPLHPDLVPHICHFLDRH